MIVLHLNIHKTDFIVSFKVVVSKNIRHSITWF